MTTRPICLCYLPPVHSISGRLEKAERPMWPGTGNSTGSNGIVYRQLFTGQLVRVEKRLRGPDFCGHGKTFSRHRRAARRQAEKSAA